MNQALAVRRILILAGPSLLALGLYLIVFRLPNLHENRQYQAKFNKLAAKASRIDFQAHSIKLAGLRAEFQRLSEVLESGDLSLSRLVAQPSASGEPTRANPPAATLADLLISLSRHHLQCVATTPVSTGKDRPGDVSTDPTHQPAYAPKVNDRCQVDIKIHGSYQAMRAALRELKTFTPSLQLITLEMAQAESTPDRFWSLTVVLRETNP